MTERLQPKLADRNLSSVRPKSPEALQAQTAAYIAETPRSQSEQDAMYTKVESLANKSLADLQQDYPQEYANYVHFLRQKQGVRNKAIAKRAELLHNFGSYSTDIDALHLDIMADDTYGNPAYLGSGMDSDVYKLHLPEGDFAVRMPRDSDIAVRVVDGHMAAAANVQDTPRFERVVAASYETGVTVSEMMTGTEVDMLDLADVTAITQEQVDDFVELFEAADRQGIITDIAESNIFYDKDAGFGLIDVHSVDVENGFLEYAPPEDIYGFLCDTLCDLGLDDSIELHNLKNRQQAVKAIEVLSTNFEVLSKFYDAVSRTLSGEKRHEACMIIESYMGELIARIEQYEDEEEVQKWIKANTEDADALDDQLVH